MTLRRCYHCGDYSNEDETVELPVSQYHDKKLQPFCPKCAKRQKKLNAIRTCPKCGCKMEILFTSTWYCINCPHKEQ